jgi:hypothetical protein
LSTHKSPIPKIQSLGSGRSSKPGAPRAASPLVQATLELQRRAGNRAAAAVLSRYYLATDGQPSWQEGEPKPRELRTDVWHRTPEHGGGWVYAPFDGVVIKHLHDIELIFTPSALLTGLMSHPAPSEMTPKGYAEDGTLRAVLLELQNMSTSGRNKPLTWPRVWQAVRRVCAGREGRGEREFPTDADEAGNWRTWKNLAGDESRVFKDRRRKLSDRDQIRALTFLRERLKSHTFVGIHATTVENVGALIREGISTARVGSENQTGKGRGFYFIPARSVADVDRSIRSASGWGPTVVAVFMPSGCIAVRAREGQNVDKLEEKQGKLNCFYLFGPAEAVIPERLFPLVRIVRDPADVTMATDSSSMLPETLLEAEPYEGPLDFLKVEGMNIKDAYREVSAELDEEDDEEDIFDRSESYV